MSLTKTDQVIPYAPLQTNTATAGTGAASSSTPAVTGPVAAVAQANMMPGPNGHGQVGSLAPGSVMLVPDNNPAVPEDVQIALVPDKKEEPDEPAEIHLGIYTSSSFTEKGLKATHPDQIAANESFKKWYKEVGAIVRAGKIEDLSKKAIKPNETLQRMTVLDGTKEVELTLVDETGATRELTLTIIDLKNRMYQYRMATTPGLSSTKAKESVEKDVAKYLEDFDRVFKKVELTRISHYSAEGFVEKRGGALDKKVLELNHLTPEIIHRKQTKDLILAADSGLSESSDWRRKKTNGPLSFIRRIEGTNENDSKEKQKRAIDRILRAESFCIQLREQLTKKIDKLKKEMEATADYNDKEEIRKRRNQFTELRDQLQNDLNRHALYVVSAFAGENNQKEQCYDAILNDFYEEIYANADADHKPSFQEFIGSPEAKPFIDYAAEATSTLITHPGKYRRYCADHGLEPKKDHINSFVIHALAGDSNDQEIPLANFRILPIAFDEIDQDEILELVNEARENVDEIFLPPPRYDEEDDEEEKAKVQSLDNASKTPEEYLKTVLNDKDYRPLFVDAKTKELHGTMTKVKRWFRDEPHFWSKKKEIPQNQNEPENENEPEPWNENATRAARALLGRS
jgi:hypothetical protein